VIRALFLDMDGTLLDEGKRIPPRTLRALLACKASGIRVFAATGRSPLLEEALDFGAEERGALADGGVFCNGACVVLEGERHYTFLDVETARRCLGIVLEHPDIQVVVQMADDLLSYRWPVPEEERKTWGVRREDVVPFEPATFSRILWIGIESDPARQQALGDRIRSAVGDRAALLFHEWGALELADPRTDKAHGIRRVLDHYRWRDDEIAVFGDYRNDIGMLRAFPHSFAMGNAADDVKAHARHVTRHNTDDGIYHALHDVLKLV
jgi:Cof subfamily protein (haloacid dehalogenase superfamily)